MTNEQILEQQVEALEKLLQLKSELLAEQERKIARIQNELAIEKNKIYPGGLYPGVQPYSPWNNPIVGPGIVYDPNTTIYGGGPIIGNGTNGLVLKMNPDGSPQWTTNITAASAGTPNGTNVTSSTTGYIAPALSLAK